MYTDHKTSNTFTLLFSVKFSCILSGDYSPPLYFAQELVMPDCYVPAISCLFVINLCLTEKSVCLQYEGQ